MATRALTTPLAFALTLLALGTTPAAAQNTNVATIYVGEPPAWVTNHERPPADPVERDASALAFPAIEGAVYPLPECGVPVSVSELEAPQTGGEPLVDFSGDVEWTTRESADGAGCELVVLRSRHIRRRVDLARVPRGPPDVAFPHRAARAGTFVTIQPPNGGPRKRVRVEPPGMVLRQGERLPDGSCAAQPHDAGGIVAVETRGGEGSVGTIVSGGGTDGSVDTVVRTGGAVEVDEKTCALVLRVW